MSDGAGAVPAQATMPPELAKFVERGRTAVDAMFTEILPSAQASPVVLHGAMRHAVFAGGKRLRPLLLIASGEAYGAQLEELLPAACSIELIHTYSLIHDDLPTFDDEELRRGSPTLHVLHGEPLAILAGDALQALAFETLARAGERSRYPKRWIRASKEIAHAAGSIGMCGGQFMDVESVGQELSLDQLCVLHNAKTGALITASVRAGALIAGASETERAAIGRFGEAIGLCFQIVDDVLDVVGSTDALGKTPGGDAARAQPTFPKLIGTQSAREEAVQLYREGTAALEPLGKRALILNALAGYVVDRDR